MFFTVVFTGSNVQDYLLAGCTVAPGQEVVPYKILHKNHQLSLYITEFVGIKLVK